MCEAQGWTCATPNCLGKPEIEEHDPPVALGNTDKPKYLLCKKCAKEKTAVDRKDIAKARRRQNYHLTGRGKKRKGRKMQSANKWPKRKFPKRSAQTDAPT